MAGFYKQQIDPVQFSLFEQFLACSLFSEERAEFVVATGKISIKAEEWSMQLTLEGLFELSENITLLSRWVKCLLLSIFIQTL